MFCVADLYPKTKLSCSMVLVGRTLYHRTDQEREKQMCKNKKTLAKEEKGGGERKSSSQLLCVCVCVYMCVCVCVCVCYLLSPVQLFATPLAV